MHSSNLMPLVTAIEAATGRRVHLATGLRWAQRGRHGVYLRTTMLGGRRLCSVQDVLDFCESCTNATSKRNERTEVTDKQRAASIARADAELDAIFS